uniref:Uncharacterized protein n=1 Tax=Calcidiscus leptoporus TaxID=127549 RepID=A0A7S0JCB6_9EUKA|mmetsp:Transcript_50430/g.116401  ORF Transcript_50430/g.116401 Transcript_50430/m.116401 type:complete len:209 (+) Transcript_50430:263-889(+)
MPLEKPILIGPLSSDDVPLAVAAPVQAQAVASNVPAVVGQPVAHGHWNFEDYLTCCAVFWCYPGIPLGQLWERRKGPKGICVKIAVLTVVLLAVFFLLSTIGAVKGIDACLVGFRGACLHTSDILNFILFIISLILRILFIFCLNFILFTLLTKLRAHIRRRDQIAETQCNGCEDCCCAFWCAPCLTSQLLRHEGLKGANYKLCTMPV